MKTVSTVILLLALASISAADTRRDFWNNFVRRKFAQTVIQQQEEAVCPVAPRTYACQSARLETTRNHQYIHVCPKVGSTEDVCFNTKLPRCCPSDLESGTWKCLTTTTLKVSGQTVQVKVHRKSGQHCIAFDDAHENIESCCPLQGSGLQHCEEIPEPPECVKQRDIYFVVDSTDSIGDDIFCRFGYVLQLIVAAINPRGLSNARVAAILYRHDSKDYPAKYLFNLADSCSNIVSNNIREVVYEYYGVEHLKLARDTLTYPNVRADQTLPNSALNLALESIIRINDRPASVITLTDGESHQDATHLINALRPNTDVLIAAGIGQDISNDDLLKLASNSSTVVHEPNRNKPIDFGIQIVETMRATAALCTDEADRILASLRAATESNLDTYCSTCMWKTKTDSQLTPSEQADCDSRKPTCGGSNLQMQAFPKYKSWNQVNMKQRLEGELIAALEGVLDRAG